MRKIEKIINVYKFDELCDSVLSLLEEAEFLVDGSVYYD